MEAYSDFEIYCRDMGVPDNVQTTGMLKKGFLEFLICQRVMDCVKYGFLKTISDWKPIYDKVKTYKYKDYRTEIGYMVGGFYGSDPEGCIAIRCCVYLE